MSDRLALGLLALSLLVSSCGKDEPCIGADCSAARDTGTADQGPDGGATGGADTGGPSDLGPIVDVGTDAATADIGGADAGGDTGVDMAPDMSFAPPADSTLFNLAIPILPRDAVALGGGMLVVGTTPSDFEAGESREGVAVHLDDDGTLLWSERFGDPSNDQFLAASRRGTSVLIGGVSRGYSVTAANNGDALLVRADAGGLGEAFSWGTANDELLYGLFDGGAVAEWIGVGEYTTDGQARDGLIMAFDANLQPLWASAFDTGSDEYFSAGVVVGDTVFVVGTTGVRNGARQSLVASVTAGGVSWAKQSVLRGNAVGVATSGQRVLVSGQVTDGNTAAPAILSFQSDGSVTGQRFPFPGASTATNIWLAGLGNTVVTGALGDRTPFLMNVDAAGTGRVTQFNAGISTAIFVRTPIVTTPSGSRLVLEGSTNTLLDVPFSLRPEASCATAAQSVSGTAIPSDAFENIALTRTNLTVAGGLIAAPRTSAIATTAQPMSCAP